MLAPPPPPTKASIQGKEGNSLLLLLAGIFFLLLHLDDIMNIGVNIGVNAKGIPLPSSLAENQFAKKKPQRKWGVNTLLKVP